jgi:NADP-dependent 3-hydroxy acid dehydrogenase YdfG
LGRRQDKLDEVSAAIKAISATTTVLAVATDVTIESDVENLYAQVQKTFGRQADVLLNNAGFLDDEKGRIGEQSVEDWWKVQVSCVLNRYQLYANRGLRPSTSKVLIP